MPRANSASARAGVVEAALLIAAGVAVFGVYAALFSGLEPWRFVPAYGDEVYYYKQAESFLTSGFAHGYWGGERETALGGCDVHGCGFMIVTGLFGRLFGWGLAGMVWFNLACTALALAAAWWLLPRPRARVFTACALAVLSSGVSIIYLESGMQEAFHLAGVLVLVPIASRLARAEPDRARRWAIAYLVLTSALALVRFNWIVALPLVALLRPDEARARRARWAAVGVALAGAIYGLAALTRPAGSFNSPLLQPGSIGAAVLDNLLFNLRQLVDVSGNDPAVVAMRVSWVLALVAAGVAVWRRPRSPERTLVAWAGAHLAILTVLQVALYMCWNHGDYRVVSIALVGVVLALVVARARTLAAALIGMQILTAPLALRLVETWNEGRGSAQMVAMHAATLAPLIGRGRHPGTGKDRWCHTIAVELMSPHVTLLHLLAMPPGYGIEVVRKRESAIGHPARFVITDGHALEGYELLGIWEPDVRVFENLRCGS